MMILVTSHNFQIFDPGDDPSVHLFLVLVGGWAGVQRCLEPVADLLHTQLDLLPVEEHNKHRLHELVTLG